MRTLSAFHCDTENGSQPPTTSGQHNSTVNTRRPCKRHILKCCNNNVASVLRGLESTKFATVRYSINTYHSIIFVNCHWPHVLTKHRRSSSRFHFFTQLKVITACDDYWSNLQWLQLLLKHCGVMALGDHDSYSTDLLNCLWVSHKWPRMLSITRAINKIRLQTHHT